MVLGHPWRPQLPAVRPGPKRAAIWRVPIPRRTVGGMGELDALNLTRRAWWCLGVLAYIAWAISAALEGDGAFALIAAPVLVLVGVAAFWLVDRWVRKGQPE
jgi:hypothetical protein